MGYLIDTNVWSELQKGERANPGVQRWFAEVSGDDLFLSVLVIGEVRRGIERLRRRGRHRPRTRSGAGHPQRARHRAQRRALAQSVRGSCFVSFPRYPEYEDSGVEWLGEVPAHWPVISIKWLSPVQRSASPRPIEDPKYFDDDGEYSWVRIADVSASDGVLKETAQRLSELGSSLSVRLQPGDLFVSIAGTVGKPCISEIKACIHDGFVYFPSLRIPPRFLYRLFEAGTCYAGLGKMGTQLT